MQAQVIKVEALLASFPDDRDEILVYVDKARKLSHDCGCHWGAFFVLGAVGVLIAYATHFRSNAFSNPLELIVLGTILVFLSGLLGKLTGIGYARIRLALLLRHLAARYRTREHGHVNVH